MLRRSVGIVAIVALVGTIAGWTAGGGRRGPSKHKVDNIVQLATISTQGPYPAPGSSIVAAGPETGEPVGHGALVGHVQFTGQSGSQFTFSGTCTTFGPHGSITGTLQGTASVVSDGTINFTGTEKITGATERYRGARGALTFTGAQRPGSTFPEIHLTGTLTY